MPFTPNIGSSQGDGYTGRTVDGPVPPAYREDYLDAPYLPYEIQNELLGLWGASVAPSTYRQLLTCGSGDAIGSAVRLVSGVDHTVTTATADTQAHTNVIGFIRSKPSPTTCYIANYYYITGLAASTSTAAGESIYLANDGSFSDTPGTFEKILGTFDSQTTGYLNASPVITTNVVKDYIKTVESTPTPIGVTTEWQDFITLTLNPAKTYDICATAVYSVGSSAPIQMGLAISLYSGNDITDHVEGDNVVLGPPPVVNTEFIYDTTLVIPNFRITGVTTVYCKVFAQMDSGNPLVVGNCTAIEA